MPNTLPEDIIREAVRDMDLRPSEIPSIDLYIDQIISLVSDKLEGASPRYRDRVLTKTMINNYSKDGLIKPVKGKKYTKEQILQMLLIYSLKGTFSIGEIKRVMDGVYATDSFGGAELARVYGRFVDTKDSLREKSADEVASLAADLGLDLADETDFLLFLLSLSTLSQYLKNTAEALLEARYPEPEPEKAPDKSAKKPEKEKKDKKADKNKPAEPKVEQEEDQ